MSDITIERQHFVDLAIAKQGVQSTKEACKELVTGLLVRHDKLIPAIGLDHPVIRFSGPRGQLEELVNRYRGVPGIFPPAPWNPDRDLSEDEVMEAMLEQQVGQVPIES